MKKILAGLTALAFALALLVPAAAPANAGFEWAGPWGISAEGPEMEDHGDFVPEACAPISKEWFGADNNDIELDSRRTIRHRTAWRVTYCGNSPTHIQTYLAVTCWYDGARHPCSFGWSVNARHVGSTPYESRANYNGNTGSDGFASTYGPAHSVPTTDCNTHHMSSSITDPGIAGVVFDMSNGNNPDGYNRCI